ncbi:uncharacterized protein LAJ45_02949 [Morchella importuna]|uniref:uncharacterized protein n=1 Tax=Morchella importuna TaxID=1174673 RepID=UPI001E8DE92B|nr:uncharacterized protein LAJ45_02949 [Morchella importuna]KAH8152725.1 hypothetical protein LAJ45_02949 [Morchella importuna]
MSSYKARPKFSHTQWTLANDQRREPWKEGQLEGKDSKEGKKEGEEGKEEGKDKKDDGEGVVPFVFT